MLLLLTMCGRRVGWEECIGSYADVESGKRRGNVLLIFLWREYVRKRNGVVFRGNWLINHIHSHTHCTKTFRYCNQTCALHVGSMYDYIMAMPRSSITTLIQLGVIGIQENLRWKESVHTFTKSNHHPSKKRRWSAWGRESARRL